jgi:flagellar biosynthesis protein FlhA
MSTAAMAPTALGAKHGMGRFMRHMDVALACGVIGVVLLLVIPLPTFLVDVLLCIQIALSLSILLGTIYSQEPLEFSGFPPMLLLVTLMRLALNVATARLILLNGDAGHVIESFGQFVVGGNYIVGFTIFLILITIQFVVITKGAGRVAEVAARFTLDAMPGKQMAIDADLNAGVIDEQTARARRQKIEREASFYGAMDGASKFVRGDAIAAIIITLVNLLGGVLIGVIQRGLEPMEALRLIALLTIGDGLVTQIPALLISTAAGILVTRGSSDMGLGEDVGRQILTKPKALRVTSVFLGVFALIPGLPTVPLLALAGGTWFMSRGMGNSDEKNKGGDKNAAAGAAPGAKPDAAKPADTPEAHLRMDALELELGASLLPLVNRGAGDLLNRISQLRKKLASELGIIVSPLRVRDNLGLPSKQYQLKVRGAVVVTQELHTDKLLAINPGGAKSGLEGIKTFDPAFGLPAIWIPASQRGRGEALGYTVVEPISVLATHLQELLRTHASDLLTRSDVQKMLDRQKESDPGLVKDVVPGAVSLATLHRLLQGLLRERVPIRDFVTILEVAGDSAGQNKPLEMLVEDVRAALAPSFVGELMDDQNKLISIACEPLLESAMIQSLAPGERGPMLVLRPNQVTALVRRIHDEVTAAEKKKRKPVLVCSAGLRAHLRRLVERVLPSLPVIGYTEVPRRATLEIIGQIPATVLNEGKAA